MADTLNCPNCGAPLDYKGSDPIIRCPYCNTSVVVPENLRAKPTFSSKPSNFTLTGSGDMGSLLQKARRIKEVKDLAQTGRIEEAISLYREITDSSRTDAEAAVQGLSEGRPIMLTDLSARSMAARGISVGSMSAQAPQYSTPAIQIQTPAGNTSNRAGCLVGCFVTGLTLFILAVTLIPIFASSIPMLVSSQNMPSIAMTMLPEISTSVPAIIPTVHTFAQQQWSFGDKGTGPGLFDDPRAIAVDPQSGTIFVANYQGGRVQAFDEKGKFITQWNVGDKKTIIQGMAADHKGNLFIASGGTVYRYNSESGELLSSYKPQGNNNIYYYEGVVAAPDGTIYVVGEGENIVHLNISGKILKTIPAAISSISGDSELDSHMAIDGEGNIYLLGTFNNAVFKFGPDGKYIDKFGGDGDNPGEFRAPHAIAVDGKGNIFVSDFKGIQAFSPDGRYSDVIDVTGAAFGMTFDDQGNLYITTNQNKVTKFTISK